MALTNRGMTCTRVVVVGRLSTPLHPIVVGDVTRWWENIPYPLLKLDTSNSERVCAYSVLDTQPLVEFCTKVTTKFFPYKKDFCSHPKCFHFFLFVLH